VISKKESPIVYLPYGVRSPSAFLTTKHTKHTKIVDTEHSRTFLCLFAVCGTKKETRLFFVELGGRLSEKKAGFPACAVFCPVHRYFCIFSCVSWLKITLGDFQKRISHCIFAVRGPQPSAFLTTKHTKIMDTEHSRTFLYLFAVCWTKKETRLFFVELRGRLSEKKAGFPARTVFCPAHRSFCIFSCVSCVSWLKNRQPGISVSFQTDAQRGILF